MYGNPEWQNKKFTYELIRRLDSMDNFPWIFGWDLNECLWSREKKGSSEGHDHNMEMFRDVFNDVSLCDLGYKGNLFTWYNKAKHGQVIMKRLDRFMGKSVLFVLSILVEVIVLEAGSIRLSNLRRPG